MRQLAGVLIMVVLLALSACGGSGVKPEARKPAPVAPGDDAPRSKYGNPASYEVYGQTYEVLATARGYSERGKASWYGEDFHGKRTSSGEPYNMHAMTAAHRTLPLPTYVRVTNLKNRREVIVRVNDRGPFHDNRIIDLSFAAATELGITGTGTADVEVTAIDPVVAAADTTPRRLPPPPAVRRDPAPAVSAPPLQTMPIQDAGQDASSVLAPDEIPVSVQRRPKPGETSPIIEELPGDFPQTSDAPAAQPNVVADKPASSAKPAPGVTALRGHYLQTGAFSESKNADAMVDRLRQAGFETVGVYPTQGVLKVRLGPYSSATALEPDHRRLTAMGIRAYIVEE
jgi:rare lipoprotein A